MKSKNNQRIECFEQYKVKIVKLDAIKLPTKLWGFINSIHDQPFDLLDVQTYFQSDLSQARKILILMISKHICEKQGITESTYGDWKIQNKTSSDHLAHGTDISVEIIPPTINTEPPNNYSTNLIEDEIIVANSSKNIHLEIS